MLIWIISRDIAFSYDLKMLILGSPAVRPLLRDLKVEVFHSPSIFQTQQKKGAPSAVIPSLIVLDPFPDVEEVLDIYLRLQHSGDPLTEKVLFCSSLSYGRFEEFFEREGLAPPPFVARADFTNRCDALLSQFLVRASPSSPPDRLSKIHRSPMFRQEVARLEALSKRLRDLFYEEKSPESREAMMIPELRQVSELAGRLKEAELAEATKGLLVLCDGSRKVSLLRMKREIRDFLALLERVCNRLMKIS